LVFSDYREVALEIDPVSLDPMPSTLAPSGLADQLAGKDFYGNITRTLERAGRYERALPGEAQEPGSRSYYVFLYDWRQDNAKSAQQLYQFIEQIRKDYSNPQLEVDLIAHSMGGLIARYFLRYGKTDVLRDNTFEVNLDGADRVRRVILLGTPNLGSMSSLHAFIKGKKIGFGRLPPEVLASMPSVYQTFPHALNDWIITTRGKPLNRDLFDVRIWRRFQWSIFDPKVSQRIIEQSVSPQAGREYLEVLEAYFEIQLERGRRFVWSLTVPLPEDSYKLIVFGGDCLLTPARLLVEEVRGVSEVRLWPHEISNPLPGVDYDSLMLEPGDGIVTKASLLARESLDSSVTRHRYIDFPLDYPLFLCEKHDALTGNETFQDNLLHALLSLEPSR
jgi:pimeloyl-ACP methyl ester carboxylesterase